jgi:poly(beta-D-mannuronate) lyase
MRKSSRTKIPAFLISSLFLAAAGLPLLSPNLLNYAEAAPDSLAPTVRIASPATGDTFAVGSLTVTGTAADNTGGSGLKNVWLRVDGGKYFAVTPSAPGDWSGWVRTVTITSPGTHTLTAKATDKAGNSKWHIVTITVISSPPPDTSPPTVFASPVGGSFQGPVDVTLTASDDIDASPTVYYTVDGSDPTTSSTTYSSSLQFVTNTVLKFIAEDETGNVSPVKTETYTINVDSTPPSVSITYPSDGSTVAGNSVQALLIVSGTSSDGSSGVVEVRVRLDGENYQIAIPYAAGDWSTWSYQTFITTPGTHTLTAEAVDFAGNTEQITISIIVELETPVPDDIPAALRTVSVDSIESMMNAISSALPGDHIVLKNGVYDTAEWLASHSVNNVLVRWVDGTATDPVVITAETVGGVEMTGPAGFRFYDVSYIIIRGFVFSHSQDNSPFTDDMAIQCDRCDYVRFTRNSFALTTSTNISSDWLGITSDLSEHNRIDHNIFKNKGTEGVFLFIFGDNGDMAKYSTVDQNHFYNQYYSGGNGGECMRIGNSERGLKNAYTTVEYNLFEKCSGDIEAVTIKSSSNTFRANTFRDNVGSLTFRHGNNNVADGNFFLDGKGGIRSYGHDHKIINNYFQGLSGTGSLISLVIGSGTVEEDLNYSNSMHSRSKNVLVAFNTFYNNQNTYMRIGENFRTLHPQNITVAHNLLVGNSGTLVNYDEGESIVWTKNILYGSAYKGNMPAEGYSIIDPMLVQGTDNLYRLSPASPAIDQASASSYPAVTTDMDGQERSGSKDTGADEHSNSAVVNNVLTTSDVGPEAP